MYNHISLHSLECHITLNPIFFLICFTSITMSVDGKKALILGADEVAQPVTVLVM